MDVRKTEMTITYKVDNKYWVDVEENYVSNSVRVTITRMRPFIEIVASYESWDEALKESLIAKEVYDVFHAEE